MSPTEIDLANSRRNRIDLTSKNPNVESVVVELFEEFVSYREAMGERRPTKNHVPKFQRHLKLLVLDLLSVSTTDGRRFIGYSRGAENFRQGGTYSDPETAKPLISQDIYLGIVRFLQVSEYIEDYIAKAGYTPLSSRMRPLPKLLDLFEEHHVNWTYVRTDTDRPMIIVKDAEKKIVPWPTPNKFDLEQAIKNLRRINENLASTYLGLAVSDQQLSELNARIRKSEGELDDDEQSSGYREPFDLTNRVLRRVFGMNSFDCGGRFYGGWWQGIPSDYRKYIEIGGAVTREMDYSSIQPRIMYAEVGVHPPDDAYQLDSWPQNVRPYAKKAFNQLVNSDVSSRNENQWHRFAPDIVLPATEGATGDLTEHQLAALRRDQFEAEFGRPYSDLLRDILRKHEPIEQYFFSGAWGRLQRIDSDIAEAVMIRLLNAEVPITVLPIHDSFIVRRGAEYSCFYAMSEAFEEIVGIPAEIDLEDAVYDPPPGYSGDRLVMVDEQFRLDTIQWTRERSWYFARRNEWERRFGSID